MSNTKDDPVGVFILFGNIWEIRNDILHHGFCVQGLFCQNGNNYKNKSKFNSCSCQKLLSGPKNESEIYAPREKHS